MSFLRSCRHSCALFAILLLGMTPSEGAKSDNPVGSDPYEIQVIDSETGRGVPLVELRTTTDARYVTDNAGRVAFWEPGIMDGGRVFFEIESHGYEFPADGLDMRGKAFDVTPGGKSVVEIHRINLAERMYRITGYGLYRDSTMLGYDPPLRHPWINAGVVGQDSAQVTVYNGCVYWFWGDTDRLDYPLGNFQTTGATSPLPHKARVSQNVGIELDYFREGDFVRPMAPLPSDAGNLMWISGLITVADGNGSEKMIAHYDHRADLGEAVGQGLLVWNDQSETFNILQEIPLDETWRHPIGQATHWRGKDGDYLLFVRPWANVRVPDNFSAVQNHEAYEAFTCLAPGTEFAGAESPLERDRDGKLVWGWKKGTTPMTQARERALLEAGLITEAEARFQLRDVETGDPVEIHRASIKWNEYLEQWILIGTQIGGRSFLGEVWFASADSPNGPWRKARRIVTHDAYTFYNPVHHTFLNEEGGRIIYFEGTYTNQFTNGSPPTPYYDYNQIMYRLDLRKVSPNSRKTTPRK